MANAYIGADDYAEAAKWYRKAAEQRHAEAECQLGLLYFIGEGVRQNFTEAAQWLRKAADHGVVKAQSQLGFMYANGQGVTQDFAEAVRWSRNAANQGDAKAQLLLGAMYHNGQGVPRDYVLAYMWLSLAADGLAASKTNNDNKAASIRELVAAKMSPEQIAEAQHLARDSQLTPGGSGPKPTGSPSTRMKKKLELARLSTRNFTVAQMRDDLSPDRREAARQLELASRAQAKLLRKALELEEKQAPEAAPKPSRP